MYVCVCTYIHVGTYTVYVRMDRYDLGMVSSVLTSLHTTSIGSGHLVTVL